MIKYKQELKENGYGNKRIIKNIRFKFRSNKYFMGVSLTYQVKKKELVN